MLPWFQQLDRARDTAQVVAIARDYLATWTPEELAKLPAACRPGRIRAAADLEDLHACAVDAFRTTRDSGETLKALQLITSFLVRANLRLVQLGVREGEGDAAAENPATAPKRVSKVRDP